MSILLSFHSPTYSSGIVHPTPPQAFLLVSGNKLLLTGHPGNSLALIYMQFSSVRTHNTIINVTFQTHNFLEKPSVLQKNLTSNI